MSLANFNQKVLNKFVLQGILDRANFLKNIAVIGWVLSSLAQTCAILFNDKIPAKEKRFLIPQEIFDGLANATLFWFITSKATDFGKLLVLKKKIIPQKFAKILENFTPSEKNISNLKKSFLSHIRKFSSPDNAKLAGNIVEGAGVLAGIGGAVVSNNIVTPIIRNALAGICQKKVNEEENNKTYLNPYYGNIDYKKYNYEKKFPNINNTFKGFERHSLKI